MKYLLFLLFTITANADEAAKSIFNGKDLTGWKVECLKPDNKKSYWSAKDGAITLDTKGDTKHDYVWLTYEKELSAFELTLKVRSIRKTAGNSGVQIRSRYTDLGPDSKKSHYLNGPQIDIHPPTPYRVGLIYDETMGIQRWIYPSMKNWAIQPTDAPHIWSWQSLNDDGSYSTITNADKPTAAHPLAAEDIKQGWNSLKIRAQGNQIQTWLNGHLVTDFDGKTDLNTVFHKKYKVGQSGRISLQLHAGDDLALQFKDIMLENLAIQTKQVSITVDEKTLKGELVITKENRSRVTLFVSGSGPTDRDGNTAGLPGKNNSLKYLSDIINEGGISTLRVDKRGVAQSTNSMIKEEDLRFTTYVDDIGHWIQFLKTQGFSEIILIGHSEGALVATLAAKDEAVISLVTIAGAGRPAGDILKSQLKPQLPDELYKQAEIVISDLTEGKLVKNPPASLLSIFRPSAQPYLISWLKYDPAKEIAKLNMPTLIIRGTTDLQVTEEDAKLLNASAKNSHLIVIPGMNHVLKKVAGNMQTQFPSYVDPKLPLHEELGKAVLDFSLKTNK